MIFAFKISDNLMLPAVPEKHAGVKRLWAMDGHMYVFKMPAQTTLWSQGRDQLQRRGRVRIRVRFLRHRRLLAPSKNSRNPNVDGVRYL